jgi:hypothetical protein
MQQAMLPARSSLASPMYDCSSPFCDRAVSLGIPALVHALDTIGRGARAFVALMCL